MEVPFFNKRAYFNTWVGLTLGLKMITHERYAIDRLGNGKWKLSWR